MNRRLLDRFILSDARIATSEFKISKPLSSPGESKLNLKFQMRHEFAIVVPPPNGSAQAIQSVLDISLSTHPAEKSEEEFYAMAVKVAGLFLIISGKEATAEEINSGASEFARLLFPLGRSEISRLLAGARIPEIPLAWDIGSPRAGSDDDNETPNSGTTAS